MKRWVGIAAIWVLGACSGAQEKRQADGSWHIRCGETMGRCMNRAEVLCGDRGFRVVGGGTAGQVLGGSNSSYRTRVDSSELIVRCGTEPVPGEAEPGVDAVEPPQAPAPAPSPAGPAPLCIPGATQACVGPAGCSGGQACLADGSGFGACDCGGAPAAPAEPGEDAPQSF